MTETNTDIYSLTNELSFGEIKLNNNEINFYKKLNQQIFALCENLPEKIQTDSMLFIMSYFRCQLGLSFEFFKNFYAPSWLIIYHITNLSNRYSNNNQQEIEKSITAQSMAMFLHSLDDHLHDKSIPVSHIVLLIRSQAWMKMNEAINFLTNNNPEYTTITKELINDYYSSIASVPDPETLDNYCNHFRKQMATWMIIPLINAKKITSDTEFIRNIKNSYESFGIAWRLLDDINDIFTDLAANTHSSVFISLPREGKKLWEQFHVLSPEDQKISIEKICDLLINNNIIENIVLRICTELTTAESCMNSLGLKRFADQYRSLGETLTEWVH